MSQTYPSSLVISEKVLKVLIKLNLWFGLGVSGMLIATLIAPGPVFHALGVRGNNSTLMLGMQAIMVLGISAVPVANIIFTRLLAFVESVGYGDPFIAENAQRLQLIAWAALAAELIQVTIVIIAARVSSLGQPLHINWNFSVGRSLAILMLFVLARVFDQGARMREDLAGTV